ncbi:hypothetical protein [Agromyces aerolatus]|uniref:hypothetical protein n=1 Tax=Agromyces sp. LY-1074 TaxID=3074080 RepID=UPI00285C1F6A|nr:MULTISPECIES: hypothetical protein [unclassified Agromyces]MDR5707377.1 hypothetical protein [Agromyces sp. LY-1358]
MDQHTHSQLPADWWALGTPQRHLLLTDLWEFTRKLVRSYRLPSPIVPPCWFRHDELIQELLALKQYREDQFSQPSQGAAFDFHGQLQLWIARMRFWVVETGCTGNEHVAKTPPMWIVPGSVAAVRAEAALDELLGGDKLVATGADR